MPKIGGYIKRRQHLAYYTYIDLMVRGLADRAQSMLDVGSSNAVYMEEFDWIAVRHALDIARPYQSESAKGIKTDFFAYEPDSDEIPGGKYDFVTCFQTLEHIEDAEAFAGKLLSLSDHVLISVPFEWPAGSHWDHKQDPVTMEKVIGWFGREPAYHIVVGEPFDDTGRGRRLIAYFTKGEKPNLILARRRMRRSTREKEVLG